MNRFLVLTLLVSLVLSLPLAAVPCPSVTFSLEQTLSGYPTSIQVLQTVDYDHDGKLDLVGAIGQDGGFATLHTWRGVGDGTFEAAVSLGDTQVLDVQVINVNNDAYDDLVGASFSNRFWVRLGNATGFDAAIVTYTNYAVYDLQAGNFNEGTGNIDLVTSSLTSGVFVLYEGNGNGTFTERQRISRNASDWLTDVAVADFDDDGRYDVALSRRMSETLEVYFRNVDGTYPSTPVTMSTGAWPTHLAPADFDGDGLPDLATATWDDGTVDVFENLGSRTFSARQILDGSMPGNNGNLDSLRLVDINADTNMDIMAGAVNGSWVATWLGKGDGTFPSGNWFDTADSVLAIAPGAFDAADTDLELALGSYQKLYAADYVCASQVLLHTVSPVVSSTQPARLRALVSGISSTTPLPLGTVAFKEGSTTLDTVNVGSDGTSALDYSGLSVGDHTITAEFSGNSTLDPATSPSIVQKVTVLTTTTNIVLGTSIHGEPFDSTVVITNTYGDTILGYYYLTLDGVAETTERWSGAPLTLTLSAGSHTISAEFRGDTAWPPSTSTSYPFTTVKHAVTLGKSGDTSVRQGTAHSIQITVSATTSPTPTGTVELLRGTTSVGTASVSGGIASLTATLPRGTYDCTAVYSGDTNYATESMTFALSVLANASLVIDAVAYDSNVFIPAVVPDGTSSTVMYRRVNGTSPWSVVPSWTLASPYDDGTGMTRGVLYDYRLDATVSSVLQQSNIDSALLYTDPTLTAGATIVKLAHLAELRDSINALRTMAGLGAFAFDGTFASGAPVLASHVTALRTAASEARSALGMATASFADASLTGVAIKSVHVTDLRAAAK